MGSACAVGICHQMSSPAPSHPSRPQGSGSSLGAMEPAAAGSVEAGQEPLAPEAGPLAQGRTNTDLADAAPPCPTRSSSLVTPLAHAQRIPGGGLDGLACGRLPGAAVTPPIEQFTVSACRSVTYRVCPAASSTHGLARIDQSLHAAGSARPRVRSNPTDPPRDTVAPCSVIAGPYERAPSIASWCTRCSPRTRGHHRAGWEGAAAER